jgi:hypothetical protein
MICESAKEFKRHSLGSLWAIYDISHDIRARGEIMLEYGLPSSSHVGEDGLPEMPLQEFGCRPSFVI